jgi:hypothetical protein
MKWPILILVCATAMWGDSAPRLFYSKSFPGSTPAFMQVTVERDGKGEYKEAPDDELPLKFKLADDETNVIFTLADKLDHFKNPLESGLKVAFMGKKTFRWENGAAKGEQEFNYSENVDAQQLLDWFEKIAESAQLRIILESSAKYDRLGVDKALRQIWSAMDRKRLVALDQFLPTLDRVANNESYMHTARAKAAELAEFIRKGAPAAQ